jgi:hypothetical protein
MTGVIHSKKAEKRLKTCKTCEDYDFRRERYGQRFLKSQAVLFIDFLIE